MTEHIDPNQNAPCMGSKFIETCPTVNKCLRLASALGHTLPYLCGVCNWNMPQAWEECHEDELREGVDRGGI